MGWKRDISKGTTQRTHHVADRLRRELTEPEKRLWWHLRRRVPLDGTHFRRQVAIGPYIVDFACRGAGLIIEVDGDQHGFDDERRYDARRTAFLERQGYRVLRFSNRDVMLAIDMVLDTILAAIHEPPSLRAEPSSPLAEEVAPKGPEGARADGTAGASSGTPPTPGPSPQGGGGRGAE